MTRYISDRPCQKDHVGERYVRDDKCCECLRLRVKKYQSSNRELLAEKARTRAEKLKAEGRSPKPTPEQARATYERIKEKHLARTADYRRRNLAQYASYKRNRDARLRDGGSHTVEEIEEIVRMQRGKCAYCRVSLRSVRQHVDHIHPIARGGVNVRSNLQVLCQTCNLEKADIDPVDFARRKGRLV